MHIFWRSLYAPVAALLTVCGTGHGLADELTLETLPAADIYILGELHDNAVHHANQARIVAAIQPTALVFEMLTARQAQNGQNADRHNIKDLDAALGWSAGPWSGFHMYAPIFTAAPEAALYGAAVPPDTVRASVGTGAAAQFDGDAARYGLRDGLPPDQQFTREELQSAAHCDALPIEMLGGMVEAQRLRDAAFARTSLQALDETGGPVVLIIGNGHARTDWGVPAVISRAGPGVTVLSIGQVSRDIPKPPYDLWIVTGAADARLARTIGQPGDPCAAFADVIDAQSDN